MTMTATEFDTKALLAKAIAGLPEKTSLIYIGHDEEFSDKNCAAIIGGNKDGVFENGWDFSENEDTEIDTYLEEALDDEGDREALKDSDDFDKFRQECQERDDSTPYADVLRNTGRKLVRFYIRTGKGERIAMEDSDQWDSNRVEQEAKRLGKVAKLDFAANREVLRELVANASYGGVLCVIAYVEMRDVDKWVEHCIHGNERGRVELTFQNPQLLLHDAFNGSGHDVKVNGSITIKFGRGALDTTHGVMALDAPNVGTGYSWDETAGPYKPAYTCDPVVRLFKAKKGQKPDQPAPESWPGR